LTSKSQRASDTTSLITACIKR